MGHTTSLLVIAFNFQILQKIALGMGFAVAVMLVVLGSDVLWKIYRGATFHIHTYSYERHLHIHPHFHTPVKHQHDEHTAHHHSVPVGKKPFFVGALRGMAGSAALMLLVLATISSWPLALAYISIFGFGSVAGMFLMSALIGFPFSLTSKYERAHKFIRTTAGIVSICFGLFLAYQIGITEGRFL